MSSVVTISVFFFVFFDHLPLIGFLFAFPPTRGLSGISLHLSIYPAWRYWSWGNIFDGHSPTTFFVLSFPVGLLFFGNVFFMAWRGLY